MKTYIKILYVSIFSLFAFMTNAQSSNKNSGTLWISKDVQRISNRDALASPHFTVKSIDHSEGVISKDVHKPKNNVKRTSEVGNVISKSYSEWIISKPVNRVRG